MKLPIKKEYFDAIRQGDKKVEFRDAHITFICEDTGRTMRKEIAHARIINRKDLPLELRDSPMFEDQMILKLRLADELEQLSQRR